MRPGEFLLYSSARTWSARSKKQLAHWLQWAEHQAQTIKAQPSPWVLGIFSFSKSSYEFTYNFCMLLSVPFERRVRRVRSRSTGSVSGGSSSASASFPSSSTEKDPNHPYCMTPSDQFTGECLSLSCTIHVAELMRRNNECASLAQRHWDALPFRRLRYIIKQIPYSHVKPLDDLFPYLAFAWLWPWGEDPLVELPVVGGRQISVGIKW